VCVRVIRVCEVYVFTLWLCYSPSPPSREGKELFSSPMCSLFVPEAFVSHSPLPQAIVALATAQPPATVPNHTTVHSQPTIQLELVIQAISYSNNRTPIVAHANLDTYPHSLVSDLQYNFLWCSSYTNISLNRIRLGPNVFRRDN